MLVLSFVVKLSLPCMRKKKVGKGDRIMWLLCQESKNITEIPSKFLIMFHWPELCYMQHLVVRENVKYNVVFKKIWGCSCPKSKLRVLLIWKKKGMVIRLATLGICLSDYQGGDPGY